MTEEVNECGWILANRNGKRNRRRTFVAAGNCCEHVNGQNRYIVERGMDGSSTAAELDRRMDRIGRRTPREFLKNVLSYLERVLDGHRLQLIRVFGIGSFDTTFDSAYQMILLEAIKAHFHVPIVTSQEPVTTQTEKEYMESRGITVLPAGETTASDPPINVGGPNFTLFYMIHCTGQMYNDVLSRYPIKQQGKCNIILIGNDPTNFSSSTIHGTEDYPFLFAFGQLASTVFMPPFEPSENAFQGTSISYVRKIDVEEQELNWR